jgi:signal transduction histidine kinase
VAEIEPGAEQTEHFMSVAAHDLRNPIAVVRASAQMAQRQLSRGDQDAARVRLAAIVEQTDRVSEMLEMFLDAARAAANRLPLRPEELDLREMVQWAAERARLVSGERSERRLEVDGAQQCVGTWDRARLGRAMKALIENAFLYGDPTQPVRVWIEHLGDRVRVLVSGGGRGPDAEEANHLFELFYRGRSAAEVGHAGSGLGLYTARGIARAHGGDVRRATSSELPDAFELELPLGARSPSS